MEKRDEAQNCFFGKEQELQGFFGSLEDRLP